MNKAHDQKQNKDDKNTTRCQLSLMLSVPWSPYQDSQYKSLPQNISAGFLMHWHFWELFPSTP